ncbi:MAG: 1-deoxy-D-xylulose-5-phosphate reductoisomerase, partial [candidate division Zixibacteria bacterium]|nr:1-deoxy-D-xylulose-5-phosphate reductoisomerase [candidate division Zixibacteria bacterium]
DAIAAWPSADLTVIAAVGFVGVRPTLAAISAGKQIALANKEALVAAGSVIMPLAEKHSVAIAPIDSEHSAIWQCLRAGGLHEVRRLILTASGGPFRQRPLGTFNAITPAEAEFRDGSVIAQLGVPDMTLPIAHALFYPERVAAHAHSVRFDPTAAGALEFSTPEPERYPALALARRAYAMGPTGGAVLNAADEVAVAAFLDGRIRFPQIVQLVESVLNEHNVVSRPTIDDIESVDRWARKRAGELVAGASTRSVTTGWNRKSDLQELD